VATPEWARSDHGEKKSVSVHDATLCARSNRSRRRGSQTSRNPEMPRLPDVLGACNGKLVGGVWRVLGEKDPRGNPTRLDKTQKKKPQVQRRPPPSARPPSSRPTTRHRHWGEQMQDSHTGLPQPLRTGASTARGRNNAPGVSPSPSVRSGRSGCYTARSGLNTPGTARSGLNTPARRERELFSLKQAVLGSLQETEKELRKEELITLRAEVLGTLGEIDRELGD